MTPEDLAAEPEHIAEMLIGWPFFVIGPGQSEAAAILDQDARVRTRAANVKTAASLIRSYGEGCRAEQTGQLERGWTSKIPTEPGWYWWTAGLSELPVRIQDKVVEVRQWPGGGLCVRMPEICRHSDGVMTPSEVGGRWCGPLPQPKASGPEAPG